MKVVILSIQSNDDFEQMQKKLKRRYDDAISINPTNFSDAKTLISVLNEQSPSDEIFVHYDTDFVSEWTNRLENRRNLKFNRWNGLYDELFKQIGEVSTSTNSSEKTLDELIEKLAKQPDLPPALAPSAPPVPVPSIFSNNQTSSTTITTSTTTASTTPATKPTNFRPQPKVLTPKPNVKTVIRVIGNGGVGKTLISLNLADFLTKNGKSAMVVGDQFTALYAKERVPVTLATDEDTPTDPSLFPADFIIFDGVDSDDFDNIAIVSQKWLIVKNNVEFQHYSDHYEDIIFNDSDGFLKKPFSHIESDHFLSFSDQIFKTYQTKEELPLNSTIFKHLSLFSQFVPAVSVEKKGFRINIKK